LTYNVLLDDSSVRVICKDWGDLNLYLILFPVVGLGHPESSHRNPFQKNCLALGGKSWWGVPFKDGIGKKGVYKHDSPGVVVSCAELLYYLRSRYEE
jgi:hypothetical protein